MSAPCSSSRADSQPETCFLGRWVMKWMQYACRIGGSRQHMSQCFCFYEIVVIGATFARILKKPILTLGQCLLLMRATVFVLERDYRLMRLSLWHFIWDILLFVFMAEGRQPVSYVTQLGSGRQISRGMIDFRPPVPQDIVRVSYPYVTNESKKKQKNGHRCLLYFNLSDTHTHPHTHTHTHTQTHTYTQ